MLGFILRMVSILVQHAMTGLQTPDASVSPTRSAIVDEILSEIAPYLVNLPFISMEGLPQPKI